MAQLEHKEGVVLYSSNTTLGTVNSNIILSDDNLSYIDLTDYNVRNKKYQNEYVALSNNYIETLDLLSEGEIDGIISGNYIFSGQIGNTGWSSAIFSGYKEPTGTLSGNSWLRSVYWNEVPVLNDNGQFNFQDINAIFSPGNPNGEVLEELLDENTSSRSIGERLRYGTDNIKIYRILNRNCNGCIVNVKVTSLYNVLNDNADVNRHYIQYRISYRPLFSSVSKNTVFSAPKTETVFGKIQHGGGYIRSTRIEFNTNSFTSDNSQQVNIFGGFLDIPDFFGWEIKIQKITPDSTTSQISEVAYIDSLTELYGSKLSYPYSAIIKTKFNSQYFSSVPDRAFECNLLKVKIPGNYDPILRTYATSGFATTNGYWNGEFATGKYWTNNPVWCFYDMLSNNRYGLGRYLDNLSIDKFNLYKISQYCDELVSDGEGGIEPRFTCNTWIAGREDAFNVINDLASVFRAMIYYANGQIFTVQDSKKEPVVTFTNANVEDGDFNYSSVSKKSRHSVAIVRYNDPRNFYKPTIEYVEDIDSIRKYGVRELDTTVFACTSRGQAIRYGRWSLLSNNIENETIQFSAGLEGAILRPGDIFKVIDSNKKQQRYGGRVFNIQTSGVSGAIVTLDSNIPNIPDVDYKLSLLTPSYTYNQSQVSGLTSNDISDIRKSFLQEINIKNNYLINTGHKSVITITGGLDSTNYNISGNIIWTLELGDDYINYTGNRYFYNPDTDLYRVINVRESDVNKYDIVGLRYWDDKFNEVDSGILYQRSTISNQTKIPTSPHDLTLTQYKLSNSLVKIVYTFLVDNYNYINSHKIYMTTGEFDNNIPANNYLINILPVNMFQGNIEVSKTGIYKFRVYSYNDVENIYSSNYSSSDTKVYLGNPIINVTIANLNIN